MIDKVYIVTDLGPGDGGKGGVVHALSCRDDASIIIKRGGAQGSHGVRTSAGESFNFSQWGCGTFEGVPTFLSSQMVISPVGLENESDALKHCGIYDPYTLLSVDPNCVVATSYHKISSQIEELLRRDHPRGTIGTGVGQAYRMACKSKRDTILASTLIEPQAFSPKLQRQRVHYRKLYGGLSAQDVLPEDAGLLAENLSLLLDDGFFDYTVNLFTEVGKKLNFSTLREVLKTHDGTAIVECSHGVLTDAETGFRPHVSAIHTLPEYTNRMIKEAGFNGKIINLAVHRAYSIRHGASPLPTHSKGFTAKMLPGSHKMNNRWQGEVRAGILDVELLRHAIDASKQTPFDGICITWFDQILTRNTWFMYDHDQTEGYFLGRKPFEHQQLFRQVDEIVRNKLNLPLYMLSIGPTEHDKIFCEAHKEEYHERRENHYDRNHYYKFRTERSRK